MYVLHKKGSTNNLSRYHIDVDVIYENCSEKKKI